MKATTEGRKGSITVTINIFKLRRICNIWSACLCTKKKTVAPHIGSKLLVLAFMIQLLTLSLALGKFITYFKAV